jgi:signal transduction histidine kinase
LWSPSVATAEIATEIHDLSHRLHSSKLEALGLVAAVRGLCREFGARGIAVDFVDQNVPDKVPYDLTLCLFRIVQEGLNNVVKHSGVHQARVTLAGYAGTLTLSIVDDGRGFGSGRVGHGGLGLASMRERLRSLGGRGVICSEPGRGTRIEARVFCGERPFSNEPPIDPRQRS